MWSYSCMLVKVTAWMCKSIFIYPHVRYSAYPICPSILHKRLIVSIIIQVFFTNGMCGKIGTIIRMINGYLKEYRRCGDFKFFFIGYDGGFCSRSYLNIERTSAAGSA